MAGDQRRRGNKRALLPGRRRLEWVAEIAATVGANVITDLDVRVASIVAWQFMDATTGETFAGFDKIGAAIRATDRAILGSLARLCAARFLLKIERAAPGRPTKYRMTFPAEQQDEEDDDEVPF
jgi:hypothetical protein